MLEIRSARCGDAAAIVQLWHQGWHEAHAELVPPAVLSFRSKSHFHDWLQEARDTFHVALSGGAIAGFISVQGAEVVKLYVNEEARGRGVAAALLGFAERALYQAGIREAELRCIAGNARAERFYHRQGWTLVRTDEDGLWIPRGVCQKYVVPTHRFGKTLIVPWGPDSAVP